MGAAIAVEFSFTIERQESTTEVGLMLDTVGNECAMVTRIKDGLINVYNQTAVPERQVQPGDFVMRVNSVSGDTDKMALAVGKEGRLEFTIRRAVKMTIEIERNGKNSSLGLG